MAGTAVARGAAAVKEARGETPHSFTGRMCAASRAEESARRGSLFTDNLAHRLAGHEGRASPMGAWILVPRTRFGADRLPLPELRVFEVDQKTTFDVKEPLLRGEPHTVATDFPTRGVWTRALRSAGFDPA